MFFQSRLVGQRLPKPLSNRSTDKLFHKIDSQHLIMIRVSLPKTRRRDCKRIQASIVFILKLLSQTSFGRWTAKRNWFSTFESALRIVLFCFHSLKLTPSVSAYCRLCTRFKLMRKINLVLFVLGFWYYFGTEYIRFDYRRCNVFEKIKGFCFYKKISHYTILGVVKIKTIFKYFFYVNTTQNKVQKKWTGTFSS